MANNFVWYELMTTDAKAAQGFYSKVVGWKPQDATQPGLAPASQASLGSVIRPAMGDSPASRSV